MTKIKFLAAVLAAWGFASAASATDLLQTYREAQSEDPVFAAAIAAHQAALEKLPQGRSLLLPSVSLNANSTYNQNKIQYFNVPRALPFPMGKINYNNHGYGLTLVQPLFRMQNWEAYNEAQLQVVQADAQFRNAQNDLILRVAKAYFAVLIAQDGIDLANAQKAAISEQLAEAKRNFEVGTSTITDTREAQSRYDLVVAQEIAAQSTLEIKKRQLQQLTNSLPGNLNPLGNKFELQNPVPAKMHKWVDMAMQGNLQLNAAEIGAELADKEVARARSGHYPTVDLVANYSMNNANGGMYGVASDLRSQSVGVQVNVPIFEGGAVQSKLREAEANRTRAQDELENAKRNVSTETSQAYLGVFNGIAQVKALQAALKSSESMLEATKLGQEVGVRTNVDVLHAPQQLYSTRRNLYQAEYTYLVSKLELKAAVGQLSDKDLAAVNQALY